MRRRPWGLLCLCLATTATLATTAPAGGAPCARTTAARQGKWYVATPPLTATSPLGRQLTGGQNAVRAVAVDAADPRVVLVTDGAALLRSDDGGCTWTQVYALPAAPGTTTPDTETGEIRSIDVTRVAGRTRVLLAVEGVGHGSPVTHRTVVVRSEDGRTGWTAVTDATFSGVYDAERGRWTPVVRSAGTVAYAAVPAVTGAVAYFRSTDGGRTWALRSSLADQTAAVRLTSFAVSPWNPDELWEWGGRWSRAGDRTTGLRRSTDGGATWTWLDPWPSLAKKPSWLSADVAWPRRDAPARVVVLGEADDGDADLASPVVGWSGDGGKSFLVALPPDRTTLWTGAVTHLANGDAVVVAADKTAFRIAHRGRAPLRADWRRLPAAPEAPASSTAGYDNARASVTRPAVVAVPTARTVQLLTVAG